MARDAGLEPGRPLSIRRLLGGSDRDDSRDKDRDRKDEPNRNNKNEVDEFPAIPRFGDDAVQSFGLSPLTLAGKIIDLEKKYDRRVMDTVNKTMERYDKNKNGILDHDEWKGIPWRSDPRDSDLDNDGILTKAEYAERIHKRYNSGNDRGGRDRGSRDRNDDREREREREREKEREREREREREKERGGDDRGRRGGWDPSSWISRMDANGNGRIDPDEVDERRRKFFADRFQLDFSKPIEIKEITERFRKRMEDRERERDGDSGRDSRRRRERDNSEEKSPSESYRVDGSSKAKGRKSYRSEGRSLPKALPGWWEDRDENSDGQITLSEFASAVDERIIEDFRDFDINGDGLITAREAEILEDDE